MILLEQNTHVMCQTTSFIKRTNYENDIIENYRYSSNKQCHSFSMQLVMLSVNSEPLTIPQFCHWDLPMVLRFMSLNDIDWF